jgi:hypothetical protein
MQKGKMKNLFFPTYREYQSIAKSILHDCTSEDSLIKSHPSESNRRPTHYECVALPTELGWHK